jgi:hypothetical protein
MSPFGCPRPGAIALLRHPVATAPAWRFDARSRPYENSFVTGVPVTIRDGRLVKSS